MTATKRRSPGDGTVFETAEGWRAAVTWTDDDGTRRKRIVRARTKTEARAKLEVLKSELGRGTIAPAGRTVTTGTFLREWLDRDRARVRPASWRQREMHVRVYLVPRFGRIPVSRLTAIDVERAMGDWLRTISPRTVRHVRGTLRHALADAVRDGLIVRNPAAEARPPRVESKPITYLDGRTVRRLIEATRDAQHGPLWAVIAATGLRAGEALGLSWSDVDGGVLRVRRSMALAADGRYALSEPKTRKSRRTIPLPQTAREALAIQRDRQAFARRAAGTMWQDRDDLVFTGTIGQPLRPDDVGKAFARDARAAGVPQIGLPGLRHSAATSMVAAGVPLVVVSEWLGHAGIAVTAQHYAAVVPTLLDDAAAAMDRALAG